MLDLGLDFRWVDVKLASVLTTLPSKPAPAYPESATAGGFGAGLRFKLPYDETRFSPWVDADVLYYRTGSLDRFAYTFAIGGHAPIGPDRNVRIGPVFRLLVVNDVAKGGFDTRDALLISFGLSMELGVSPPKKTPQPAEGSFAPPPDATRSPAEQGGNRP